MRRKRGQTLIVTTIGIVFILLSVSSLLISTYLSGVNLPKEQFRETVSQIYFGSKGVAAMALADVSKQLNLKANYTLYRMYTNLDEWPEAKEIGFKEISKWQTDTMRYYPVTGLSINFTGGSSDRPEFQCNWNDKTNRFGFSRVVTNLSVSLLNYGFRGFREQLIVEFNSTIKELLSNDGRMISFKASFVREEGYPLDNMEKGFLYVFLEIYNRTYDDRTVLKTEVVSTEHIRNGIYLINCNTGLYTISNNLDSLEQGITDEVTNATIKQRLLGNMTEIKAKYSSNNINGTSYQLSTSVWNDLWSWNNETHLLSLTDTILSQLKPFIRVVALDFRGITVSSYGELFKPANDIWGPDVYGASAQPGICPVGTDVTLNARADDRYNGNANVTRVEYFISATQPSQGQYGSGRAMNTTDGVFEPLEDVSATILSGYLHYGENKIWIHAKDSKGNWGGFTTVKVTVQESSTIRIDSISMQGMRSRGRYWIRATVKIVDVLGNPVAWARVKGNWTRNGHWEKGETKYTDSYGTCIFDSPQWSSGRRTYTFTAYGIYKDGYTWDGQGYPTPPYTYP